jgi:hypothetical protein
MKILIFFMSLLSFAAKLQADPPAVHGMLLFGDKGSYLSHLPMFHSPHDYQLIMKISLADLPRSQTSIAYETAKSQGEKLFTLVPQAMDLTKIIDGSITSFSGVIYQGHFERGGKALGITRVEIEKIILATKLEPETSVPALESYSLFGEQGEYFAAHLIGGRPNFDLIVSIDQPHQLVMQRPCTRAECPPEVLVPLNDSDLPVTVESTVANPQTGEFVGQQTLINAQVIVQIYHETGDLEH